VARRKRTDNGSIRMESILGTRQVENRDGCMSSRYRVMMEIGKR